MNAWGKVNGVKGDEVLFLSDTKTFFSKEHGWPAGMGDRNGRWAMVFDHGKVTYAENEKSPGEVSVSCETSEFASRCTNGSVGIWC
jgi:alkyl hydroperoxide reductase 1